MKKKGRFFYSDLAALFVSDHRYFHWCFIRHSGSVSPNSPFDRSGRTTRNTYFRRFRNLWSESQSSFEYVYVMLNTSSWPSWIVSGYPSTVRLRTTFVDVDENEKSSIRERGSTVPDNSHAKHFFWYGRLLSIFISHTFPDVFFTHNIFLLSLLIQLCMAVLRLRILRYLDTRRKAFDVTSLEGASL